MQTESMLQVWTFTSQSTDLYLISQMRPKFQRRRFRVRQRLRVVQHTLRVQNLREVCGVVDVADAAECRVRALALSSTNNYGTAIPTDR